MTAVDWVAVLEVASLALLALLYWYTPDED